MPSWGIHLTTASAVAEKIKIMNKNGFIIGNFLPDAERYVVKDFSIFVPYDISHFAKKLKINGVEEKLPDYMSFINKYKQNLNNPILLGYLTHLITDYYWNNLTFSKYTASNENGEVIGVLINETDFVGGDKELRRILKQKDFANFDNEVLQTKAYKMPEITNDIINELNVIEETKYNSTDIEKILDYLEIMIKTKKQANLENYTMFTKERINEYYEESIEFIVNILNDILYKFN